MTFIKSGWKEQTIVGVLDAILGYTMVPLVKHYLPAVKNAIKGHKPAKGNTVKKLSGSGTKKEMEN
jgi:hypothetical protein